MTSIIGGYKICQVCGATHDKSKKCVHTVDPIRIVTPVTPEVSNPEDIWRERVEILERRIRDMRNCQNCRHYLANGEDCEKLWRSQQHECIDGDFEQWEARDK